MGLCECGCGKEIIIKKHHKYYGIPKYIRGHYFRTKLGKEILSLCHKNRIFSQKHKENLSKSGKGRIFSEEHKRKMKENHTNVSYENNPMYGSNRCGIENPNWKGGITKSTYCEKWTEKLREEIRERDNQICQNCNKTKEENNNRKLSVHHIHYDKENCYPDLITLCCSCNSIVNSNRLYWEYVFMSMLTKRKLLNYFGDIK